MERVNLLKELPELLLPWYAANKRDLPWRRDKEPYHVWLSEIMLQQTRVEAVKGYYDRFLTALPDIEALANAEEAQLLKLWEGLGYYSRVRNLQRAAKEIMSTYSGVFPGDYATIRSLPGIGDYTAGAIASICFDEKTPAVDGNVLRVVTRLCNDHSCTDDLKVKRSITSDLREIYPKEAGTFTQALMELGATVCIPNGEPLCHSCPLRGICLAKQQDTILLLPVRAKKKPRKTEAKTVFLLTCGNEIAICQRPNKGLLAGLYEFPNLSGDLTPEEIITTAENWGLRPEYLEKTVGRTHIFTHITWNMTGARLHCGQKNEEFLWVSPSALTESYALPTAFRQFLPDFREDHR